MGIVLGANQYGKAENRVVRIYRDTDRHEIRDLNVSTVPARRLRGRARRRRPEPGAAHRHPEEHRLRLRQGARRRLARGLRAGARSAAPGRLPGGRRRPWSRVQEYAWDRLAVGGPGTTTPSCAGAPRPAPSRSWSGRRPTVRSGLTDLTVLKSTGSEFKGFLVDEYTTLAGDRRPDPGDLADRDLAPRAATTEARDWDASYAAVRALLLETFATTYSRALQETLHAMGRAVLEAHDDIVEISFAAPNRHHFLVDLAPVRARQPRRGVLRRGPALRADRGDRHPRRGVSHAMPLDEFNALPPDEARARVAACLDVPRWVEAVVDGRPYADVDASSTWPPGRASTSTTRSSRRRSPGTRGSASAPSVGRHDAARSAHEQAGVDRDDADVARRSGGQPCLRGALRPGLPDPRRRPGRRRDARRARAAARQRRRRPSGPRPSSSSARSRCCGSSRC